MVALRIPGFVYGVLQGCLKGGSWILPVSWCSLRNPYISHTWATKKKTAGYFPWNTCWFFTWFLLINGLWHNPHITGKDFIPNKSPKQPGAFFFIAHMFQVPGKSVNLPQFWLLNPSERHKNAAEPTSLRNMLFFLETYKEGGSSNQV